MTSSPQRKPIPTQFDEVSPDPVLVMGMHNSGSTALSQCLHRCGLFMVNNATQCESHFFSNYVNDELLMGGGTAWARLPIMSVEEVMSYRDTVGRFILDQWRIDLMQWGYDGVSPWGIKDPRLCVLLPLYLEIFPGAKILFIRRDLDDIAASLSHREKPGVGVLNDPALEAADAATLRASRVVRALAPFIPRDRVRGTLRAACGSCADGS